MERSLPRFGSLESTRGEEQCGGSTAEWFLFYVWVLWLSLVQRLARNLWNIPNQCQSLRGLFNHSYS